MCTFLTINHLLLFFILYRTHYDKNKKETNELVCLCGKNGPIAVGKESDENGKVNEKKKRKTKKEVAGLSRRFWKEKTIQETQEFARNRNEWKKWVIDKTK